MAARAGIGGRGGFDGAPPLAGADAGFLARRQLAAVSAHAMTSVATVARPRVAPGFLTPRV